MSFQRQLRNGFLTIIKHTLNPLTRRIARSSSGPFGIIRHTGRRSGKLYETPIMLRPVGDGFVIELTYGQDVDWHKNVLAAGGCCTVVWHGKEYAIGKIEPIDTETGRATFSPPQQLFLRLLGKKQFEKMKLRQ